MTLTDQYFPEQVKARLEAALPGRAAQYRMATIRRLEENEKYFREPGNDARVASVINLLHWHEGSWRTVLIQRSVNPRDRHSGQVSFPGGSKEQDDATLERVALREAEEEVGVPAEKIKVLGKLTDLYIPVSNFIVHPFVGVIEGESRFLPQQSEVASILTPSIETFRATENRKVTNIELSGGFKLSDVPYFDVEGRVVWGATAMIMNEFLEAVFGGVNEPGR